MRNIFVSALLLVVALNGCSNHDEETKSTPANPAQANVAAATSLVAGTSSQTTVGKDYGFKGIGVLRLTFPKTWIDSPKRIMEGTEPVNAIDFMSFNGSDFQVHVEVRNPGESIAKSFDIRASLMQAGSVELPDCVEQSLDIHDFKGPEASGAYYTVTDKRLVNAQPKAGEFKYLTQGYAKLAGTLLKFRVVSNQAPGEEIKDAVEMIRNARFTRR